MSCLVDVAVSNDRLVGAAPEYALPKHPLAVGQRALDRPVDRCHGVPVLVGKRRQVGVRTVVDDPHRPAHDVTSALARPERSFRTDSRVEPRRFLPESLTNTLVNRFLAPVAAYSYAYRKHRDSQGDEGPVLHASGGLRKGNADVEAGTALQVARLSTGSTGTAGHVKQDLPCMIDYY